MATNAHLTPNQKTMLMLLGSNKNQWTTRELADFLDKPDANVLAILRQLEVKGKIVKHKFSYRSNVWTLRK